MPKKGKGELSDKRAITPIRPSTAPPPTGQIIGVKDQLKNWLPADNITFFFELVRLVCLIIGAINFAEKGDTSLVLHVLEFVAGYVGIGSFLSKGKGKDQ